MINPNTGKEMTLEEMSVALSNLTRTNAELVKVGAQLKAGLHPDRKISFKVSPKTGAICLYGLGRFPTTLYKRQWQRLFAQIEELKAFVDTVPDDASVKVDEEKEAA